MGDQALKTYNGFQFESDTEHRTVDEIMQKFESFAVGEVNETYERYVFNKRNQNEGDRDIRKFSICSANVDQVMPLL